MRRPAPWAAEALEPMRRRLTPSTASGASRPRPDTGPHGARIDSRSTWTRRAGAAWPSPAGRCAMPPTPPHPPQHRAGGRQRRGVRRCQRLDRPRPEADLPDRRGADRLILVADPAQRARAAVPAGGGRARVRRDARSRRARFQALGGATGVAFTLPLVLFLFVVALGHGLQHPHDRAAARGDARGASPREAVAEAVRHVAPAIPPPASSWRLVRDADPPSRRGPARWDSPWRSASDRLAGRLSASAAHGAARAARVVAALA